MTNQAVVVKNSVIFKTNQVILWTNQVIFIYKKDQVIFKTNTFMLRTKKVSLDQPLALPESAQKALCTSLVSFNNGG